MTNNVQRTDYFLSIVVPCYNEQECLEELVKKIRQAVIPVTKRYEIIIVDDGSHDQSFSIVEKLSNEFSEVKGIRLSRNVGHQIALACGLENATGDVVISMDADLQHPPELIPDLLERWQQGFDIVKTRRVNHDHQSFLERLYSKCFYKFFNKLVKFPIEPDSADFRLLDKKALNAIKRMPEKTRFYRGMINYIGFSQTIIPFTCPSRFAGERSYTVRQSLKLAANGIFSFSNAGLKIPLYMGIAVLAILTLYILTSLGLYFFGILHFASGWFSIISILFLSLGLQLLSFGIFGLYLAKIYQEIQNRPLYFIDETTKTFTSLDNRDRG